MSQQKRTILFVEFRGVACAPQPFALVVVDSESFSRKEVQALFASERNNPNRFQWFDSYEPETLAKRVEDMWARYKRAQEPEPEINLKLVYFYP